MSSVVRCAAIAGTVIVDNIAAHNALTRKNAQRVYVVNATGDSTANSGGAEYMWRSSTSAWIKLSEAESQDLVLAWANITGKPSSGVAAIDDAVAKRHSHANATQLDKIGEDGAGNVTYGGARPRIAWDSTGW